MIKSWKLFLESYSDEVADICKKYAIKNWVINPDTGLVDINGNVRLDNHGLTKLPIKFGKISGNFYGFENNLITLEGCPKEVGGSFYCSNNKLTSLEFAPKEVGHVFYCGGNKLVSLEGLVSAKLFYADNNPIKNLAEIGQEMIDKNISFIESVIINRQLISDKEFELIMKTMDAQKILDLNNFKLFNLLRTHFPQKYADVMALRDIDLSADLGELGF